MNKGGFRWKDKSRDTDDLDRRDERRLDRGYRDRDVRGRNRELDRHRDSDGKGYQAFDNPRDRDDDRYAGDRQRDRRRERPISRNREEERRDEIRGDPFASTTADSPATASKPSKPKKEKKKEPKIAPTAEPMIIVNVNDRLGTKAAIPCLASDSIRTSPFQ